jgi:hypothetical protein
MIANLPLNIESLAARLVTRALELEEDANACAINPVPRNFDDMMVSAREMYEELQRMFAIVAT